MTTFDELNREYERTLEIEQAKREGDREYAEWLKEQEEEQEEENECKSFALNVINGSSPSLGNKGGQSAAPLSAATSAGGGKPWYGTAITGSG